MNYVRVRVLTGFNSAAGEVLRPGTLLELPELVAKVKARKRQVEILRDAAPPDEAEGDGSCGASGGITGEIHSRDPESHHRDPRRRRGKRG